MRETQPFDLKQKQRCNYSVIYAKHSVILPKTDLGMELLSHFMLDTKSFVLNRNKGGGTTQSLDSKQTLGHFCQH
jgi:hypothetical protein